MKKKRYRLRWEAVINGVQEVMAFDEEDARDQFISSVEIDDDCCYEATLDDVEECR